MAFENALKNLDSYVSLLDQAIVYDEVFSILEAELRRLGFDRFTYWLQWPADGPRVPLWKTTYKSEWTEHYLAQDFVRHDPVAHKASRILRPFLWRDIVDVEGLTAMQRKVMEDGKDIGIKVGASIPVHGPGAAKAMISLISDGNESEFQKLFQLKIHELYLIASYTHERLMALGADTARVPINLTPRETEVLIWTAQGKTAWEIGQILSLSEVTVKHHLTMASRKLGTTNKVHAIATAILNGIIIP